MKKSVGGKAKGI